MWIVRLTAEATASSGRSAHPATRVSVLGASSMTQPRASAFGDDLSERIPERELRQPHEPGLSPRSGRTRIAGGCRDPVRRDAVEQVDHLDLDLREPRAAEPDVLRDRQVDVLLRRRAHVGDGPRRVAEGVRGRGRERRRVQPRRRCVIRRREPVGQVAGRRPIDAGDEFGRCAPPNVPVLSLCCRPIGNPLCSVTIAAAVQPPAIEVDERVRR